ncbi:MAG: 5-oxoprolinase subunit PxpB [Desulfobacteraceae bacterium]|uniref:5-oxoprolinase subunit PxpB n=1 Tax=Candidatus Desulfacyla euxinica TaxID=2841693 RepID=A0A8J6N3F7_9DELT|nr:5-oxoprolinase subunit PxpB [Candidatus Desulfacyla euxinica]MBL6979513.1 5-oxoprolinase subunit PxpB [Desulfobacteraceae bacterium]
MLYTNPQYRIMGDRALLVELGDEVDPGVSNRVRELFVAIKADPLEGVLETTPSYRSLLLIFDPLETTLSLLQNRVQQILQTLDPSQLCDPRRVEIPVVYGREYGPDLEWVAGYHGITPDEVIRLHAAHTYHVYMIGFMPGFPYLGELPESLITPRRETPRTVVPRGSVALAQGQTGIYSTQSPGGWQVIGRTPLALFDPGKWPPALLEMGDRVKFFAIDEEEMVSWDQ